MDSGQLVVADDAQIARILSFSYDLSFDALPDKTRRMGELLMLDLIGVAAGAATTDASRIAHDTAAMLFGAGAG